MVVSAHVSPSDRKPAFLPVMVARTFNRSRVDRASRSSRVTISTAESEVGGQLVILAIDATILEHVRSPGSLDDGLWHFVWQRLARVVAKPLDDGESVKLYHVGSVMLQGPDGQPLAFPNEPKLPLKPGDPARTAPVVATETALVAALGDSGHPFAKVDLPASCWSAATPGTEISRSRPSGAAPGTLNPDLSNRGIGVSVGAGRCGTQA